MAKTITNREALHMAADVLRTVDGVSADLIAKLDVMAAAADKRAENAKNAPRVKSKEQREKEERATRAAAIMREHGEPVTAEWLVDNVPGLFKTSEANGCMQTAKRLGLIEPCGKVKYGTKWRTTYRAI